MGLVDLNIHLQTDPSSALTSQNIPSFGHSDQFKNGHVTQIGQMRFSLQGLIGIIQKWQVSFPGVVELGRYHSEAASTHTQCPTVKSFLKVKAIEI